MTSDPEVRDNPPEHRFELMIGDDMAVVEYRLDRDVISFEHTFVPTALRGQGIATRMIEASLASARSRGLKVVPLCPTFVAYMKSHAETHDLLTAEAKDSLGA